MQLLEDEVIDHLCVWLEKNDWKVISHAKGHTHGIDIKASKQGKILIIEAKGSKGNPKSPVTKRKRFDSGQIKIHFGEAIAKLWEEKTKCPKAVIAIAFPNDDYIRKTLINITPHAKRYGIKIFWVESSDIVQEG